MREWRENHSHASLLQISKVVRDALLCRGLRATAADMMLLVTQSLSVQHMCSLLLTANSSCVDALRLSEESGDYQIPEQAKALFLIAYWNLAAITCCSTLSLILISWGKWSFQWSHEVLATRLCQKEVTPPLLHQLPSAALFFSVYMKSIWLII